ncbi:hypothetical protein T4D_14924 [Trichinella pseudospiralis]|uniref:Uncharacterized protein n=1 Tax=Trichinella pseudospiralis TaxID=6337 RepID=A0A0V1FRH4_TRIPS|nr:hypothetical protein T4D_14924 [Trichinella pseudospiralis]
MNRLTLIKDSLSENCLKFYSILGINSLNITFSIELVDCGRVGKFFQQCSWMSLIIEQTMHACQLV